MSGSTVCVSGFSLHQLGVCLLWDVCVYGSPLCSVCVHMCVHGWLPSLCLAFAARARALRLPRGLHCPRSPQPSGHRCSPFDTVLLTHTPHSPRCVGGQAGRPVARHTATPLDAWCVHVTLNRGGKPSRRQF